MEKSISLKKVITVGSAICAFWIGAGFATGQEILQFFATSGIKGIIAALIFLVIAGVVAYSVCSIGQKRKFENPYDIYEYYCGKWVGKFYSWVAIASMYGSVIVILAGGGATIHQFYGIPIYISVGILALLALGTAVLGIEKLIKILGAIGVFKVGLILILGIFGIATVVQSPDLLLEGDRQISTAGFKTGSPNWALSGAIYALFCSIEMVPFFGSCGATTSSVKEARLGAVAGTVAYTLTIIMMVIAEIIYYPVFIGKQVPALAIASHIHPVLGMAYTFMIVVAVYSAVASMLTMTTRKFAVDKTKKFNTIATVLTVVAVIVGALVQFDTLVNILFTSLGYLGVLFIVLMVYKEVRGEQNSPNCCNTKSAD